jgi:hypothetical protein
VLGTTGRYLDVPERYLIMQGTMRRLLEVPGVPNDIPKSGCTC